MGHEFSATQNWMSRGAGCPRCNKRLKTIEEIKEMARARGGECLSLECPSSRSLLTYRCAVGHEWTGPYPNFVCSENWCQKCAFAKGHRVPKTMAEIQEAARQNGGECLSTECKNTRSVLTWKCDRGHVWEKTYLAVVLHKTWCPTCRRQSRSRAEDLFFKYVKTVRPDAQQGVRRLLRQSRAMQLDVFVPALRKAIEFDGEFWHASDEGQARDRRKDEFCRQEGIDLLRVPFSRWRHETPLVKQEVRAFLAGSV